MNLPKSFFNPRSCFNLVAKSIGIALISCPLYAEQNLSADNQSAVSAPQPTEAPLQQAETLKAQNPYADQISVEIIAFQRLLDTNSQNQTFAELNTTIPTADAILPSEIQINARAIPNSEMQLNDIYTKFQQHDAYIPFYHQAWTQNLNQQSLALPIHIQSDPNLLPAVDGRFTVWQDENIELNFNLAFSYNDKANEQHTQTFGSVEQPLTEVVPDIDATIEAQPKAVLNSDLTTKTIQYQSQSSYTDNQMMYFDHPLFGILVLINSADGKPLKGVKSDTP